MLGKPAFRFNRRHASGACGRNGLAIRRVRHIATRVNAFDGCLRRTRFHFDVARIVEVELVNEQAGIRLVADRDEDGFDVDVSFAAVVDVREANPRHVVFADDFFDFTIPRKIDQLMVHCALGHDLAGPQLLASMNHRDLGRKPGEEERFFHRGVAAADDRHRLIAKQCAVAGRARRHAVVHQPLFRVDPEPAR